MWEWIQSADNTMILLWLALLVLFLIAEMITVGLTSIWFAAGALIAFIAAALNAPEWLQVVLFVAVSLILLPVTRPFADRFVNSRLHKTNLDSIRGQTIRIAERVCNEEKTGAALVEGKEWTVRTADDSEIIEAGAYAKIVEINGVKLIVTKQQDEKGGEK